MSTGKVIAFVLVMTTVVALTLSSLFYGLQDKVKINEEVYNKKATLSALASKLPKDIDAMTNEEVIDIFNNQIKQKVITSGGEILDQAKINALGYASAESLDMANEKKKPLENRVWPLFEYTDNGQKYYIISMRGNGLWDEIWGYMALESDLKTVAGVAFDHKGETPGLGAEIKDSKAFKEQFIGKSIVNSTGKYAGIKVRKGGALNDRYEVDGITGATITADGVDEMIATGVQGYSKYFSSLNN